MKAYLAKSNKIVEPFGDHPCDCLIANQKLGELQKKVLQELGLELKTTDISQIEDPNEHITFDDSLFFTKELLRKFISKSRELRSCTICALKPGLVTLNSMVTTQDVQIYADRVEYGLRYMPPQELRGNTTPVVIEPEQFSQTFPMPEHVRGPQEYRIPITDTLIIQVDHWTNLWAANMSALLAKVARLMAAPKTEAARAIIERALTKQVEGISPDQQDRQELRYPPHSVHRRQYHRGQCYDWCRLGHQAVRNRR